MLIILYGHGKFSSQKKNNPRRSDFKPNNEAIKTCTEMKWCGHECGVRLICNM